MAADEKDGLFDGLAEQAAPGRGGGGRPRLRKAERGQVELRALSLDDLVPADHRVRLVWAFTERLDLGPLYAAIKAVEGRPGHPPADPRVLMAVWLYATTEGVGSARALARLCREHVGFQWLCGGVGMNHKTLSDFRVHHGALLERLLIDSFAALLKVGIASLDRVAQDGVRVRASAGAASFRRLSTLKECRAQAEEQVARQRRELGDDPAAASRRQAAARSRAAENRLRRLTEALAAAEKLEAMRKAQAHEAAADKDGPPPGGKGTTGVKARAPRASTTDPEAKVMKMADGGFRPAYNVQFAADTRSGAVAAVSVDAIGSDMGRMAPMTEALAAAYGRAPREHLADGGYAKLDDIETLTQAGVTPYVPVPAPKDPARDRHAPPPDDRPAVAAWRRRMGTDAAKEIYKERAATVECVNAQARNRGLTRFVVRGVANVRAAALWYALAHNMACAWRLVAA
jgi:transposase